MSDIKFSVSMCVYGGDNPEWFKTAVESVLNQTVKASEIVLVVDGPVPEILDNVIKKYEAMPVFNVVRFAENQGHGNARRAGLKAASNELVALMDADDICVPERFEKQLEIFENDPDVDIVGGNISEFIGTPENIVAKREVPSSDTDIKEYMKKRCPMNQMTVLFKKSSVEKVGGYLDWYCDEDYYLWIRMAIANMTFANMADTLVYVRVGEQMYQRRGGRKYFKSEAKLQKYMREHGIIGFGTYTVNVTKRFIVQILLPNKIRGWVFKKFAREKV
ncbi:MAG: glycosyltransferase [Ruminococcaceae bacterium]|nr:glycosyltransferase [Oscillospiraceae bacterium]